MNSLETTDIEVLLEEILSSAITLKEATLSQKQILENVNLSQLDRVLLHKTVLIDKIRAIHQELKQRGLDFADRNGVQKSKDNGGSTQNGDNTDSTTANWTQKVNMLRKDVERTIREILAMEADSQKKLLMLKQHVRGILLDIQERRQMLRGYAVYNGRHARVLDTKT